MKGEIAGITSTHWVVSFPVEDLATACHCLSLFVIDCSVLDLLAHRIG
jgi:hypothetical protein